MSNKEKADWTISPITKRMTVMQELDEKTGVNKMDISTGYYTLEFPLNHTKHKPEDVEQYESTMPKSVKRLRFDDGEAYWYPSTIQTKDALIWPTGETYENITWNYAKINELAQVIEETTTTVPTYLEAAKLMEGNSISK